MDHLILGYLEPAKNALSILPSVDLRLYVSIIPFIISSFVWFGFRAVRDSDRIASFMFKPLGNYRRMHSRLAWLSTLAMVSFTLYMLAFLLSRVKLCQAPANDDGMVNLTECARLINWFQPRHLLLARAILEVVTIGLSAFWVFYKHCNSWSTLRLVVVLLVLIVLQIIESGSVLYYESEGYRKPTLLFVTRMCASINFTTLAVLIFSKLSKWQKALAQPIMVLHPEKNPWYPHDELQLDDVKNQFAWVGCILTYHYLYHMYTYAASWDFTPFDLADPYSLPHSFLLVFLGSLLPMAYLNTCLKIANDKRLNDQNPPPKGRFSFILILKEGRVVACTAQNRAELEIGEPSPEQLLPGWEGREVKAEDLA